MATSDTDQPRFDVTHESTPAESVVAGFSAFGLAGLTAVDYLTTQLELAEAGHITAQSLPSITPFEDGTPRHHTRLFSGPNVPYTVLVNELLVPPWAAEPFADAILSWADDAGVTEITILAGIPVQHGPDDHRTYYVATEDYQAARLQGVDVPGMGTGFLDGVNASLVGQGMNSALRVGVLVTPVHPQVPDVEAALRLIDGLEAVFDVEVDTGDLESFAAEVEGYYTELADRLERAEDHQVAEDRMFM